MGTQSFPLPLTTLSFFLPLSLSLPLCGSLQRNGQLETQFKSSAYAKCHVISITQHGKRIEESDRERERGGGYGKNWKRGKNKKKNSRSVYKLSQERRCCVAWPQCGRHSACCMSIMTALVALLPQPVPPPRCQCGTAATSLCVCACLVCCVCVCVREVYWLWTTIETRLSDP